MGFRLCVGFVYASVSPADGRGPLSRHCRPRYALPNVPARPPERQPYHPFQSLDPRAFSKHPSPSLVRPAGRRAHISATFDQYHNPVARPVTVASTNARAAGGRLRPRVERVASGPRRPAGRPRHGHTRGLSSRREQDPRKLRTQDPCLAPSLTGERWPTSESKHQSARRAGLCAPSASIRERGRPRACRWPDPGDGSGGPRQITAPFGVTAHHDACQGRPIDPNEPLRHGIPCGDLSAQ